MIKEPTKPGHMTLAQFAEETPITMKEVRSLFIVPPSKQTLYYWRKRGVRVNGKSVWLGWFKNGGRYMSTKEAVARFKQAYDG